MRIIALFGLMLLLAGCAGAGGAVSGDPLEGFNRPSMTATIAAYDTVVQPAATAYRAAVPEDLRRGIGNVLANAQCPANGTNSLLQGRVPEALETYGTFLLDATAGIGGFWKPAESLGLECRRNDFGLTLAAWGWEDGGPYVFVPIIGPSNPRDLLGLAVETFLDPLGAVPAGAGGALQFAVAGSGALKASDDMGMLNTFIDPYAAVRSSWEQRRDSAVRRARHPETQNPIPLVPPHSL